MGVDGFWRKTRQQYNKTKPDIHQQGKKALEAVLEKTNLRKKKRVPYIFLTVG